MGRRSRGLHVRGLGRVAGQPSAAPGADGLGKQRIYVFPTLDLVVVRSTRHGRSGEGHVRSGTTMPITPGNETWSDGTFAGAVLRAADASADVGEVCRDEEASACSAP